MTSTIAIMAAVLAASFLFVRLLHAKARDARDHGDFARRFFNAAEAVLDDPRAGPELARILEMMGVMLRRRTIVPRILFHVMSGEMKRRARAKTTKPPAWIAEAAGLNERARDQFAAAVVYGVLAVSYNHVVLGRILRASFFFLFQHGQVSPAAACSLEPVIPDLMNGNGMKMA